MKMEWFIGLLQYLGITPDKLVPLIIVVGAAFYILTKRIDGLERSLETLKNLVGRVINAVVEIQRHLVKKSDFEPLFPLETRPYLGKESPLQLMPIGEQLLQESGAKKIVDERLEFLIKKIEERKPKTAHDVQGRCLAIFWKLEDEDFMIPLKDFAYQYPEFRNNSLRFDDIINVSAIYLRNKYLERHPELLEDTSGRVKET